MNTDLKYRFDELVTAIRLAPDMEADSNNEPEDWKFPNLTLRLSAPEMVGALMCQATKENDEFNGKFVTMLTASALVSIAQNDEPTEDDLWALALAAHLLWANGVTEGLFQTLGMLGSICVRFDRQVPDLATMLLRSNQNHERFKVLNPYDFLDDSVAVEDMVKTLEESLEKQ